MNEDDVLWALSCKVQFVKKLKEVEARRMVERGLKPHVFIELGIFYRSSDCSVHLLAENSLVLQYAVNIFEIETNVFTVLDVIIIAPVYHGFSLRD